MIGQSAQHCCACSYSCMHEGGPYYCAQHGNGIPSYQQHPQQGLGQSNQDYIINMKLDQIIEILRELKKK